MLQKNKVIFFKVEKIKTKLIRIIQMAMHHFEQKEKILIKVADEASLSFVDELLWKLPKEGFLPHLVSDKKVDDFIVITKKSENLNNSNYMFNLCSEIIDLDKTYKIIYDFDDSTSQKNSIKSKNRYLLYKEANFLIESK